MSVYAENAVKEYWMFDTGNQIIELYQNENKSFTLKQIADRNDTAQSIEFPELRVEMRPFWKN